MKLFVYTFMIRNTLLATLLVIGAAFFVITQHDVTNQPNFEEWKA